MVDRNVAERRNSRCIHGGATSHAVQVGCQLRTVDRCVRAESTVREAEHDALIRVPADLVVVRVRVGQVAVAQRGGLTGEVQGGRQDVRQVVVVVAEAVDQLHAGVREACAQVCVVAGLDCASCAPGDGVGVTGGVIRANPPVHRQALSGCVSVHGAVRVAACNHDGAATVTPCGVVVSQLVGDELSATRVAHGPHLRSVQVVLVDEGLREGAEELTVGVHVFPPGDAVTGCVGIRGDDRHEDHVAGISNLAHCREHTLVGGVDLGLVTLPVVAVEVEDHANRLGVVQVVRVHVVLGGGTRRGGVALIGCGAHGAGARCVVLLLLLRLLFGLLLSLGSGGCLTLGERVAQNLGEVVVEVARAVQNGRGSVGVAGVTVGVVAALNGASCAPGLRVGLAGAVVRVCVPEHGLGLQCTRGGTLVQATASDHDGAAAVAPGLGLGVQLVGDELGATGVSHGPHVGGVHAVSRDEGGREGAEELAVTLHVFPPGHAGIVTVAVRGDDGHEQHVLCRCGCSHLSQLTGGVVDLGLVVAPVVAVEVEDHANGLGEVHTLSVDVVLRGGTSRGGVGQESLVGAGCCHTGCCLSSLCGLRGLSGRGCSVLGSCGGLLCNLCQGGLSGRLSRLCGLEGSRGGCLLSCLGSVGLLDGLNRGRCGSLLCLFCLLADLYSNLREGGLHGGGEQGLGSLGCGSCTGDVLNDGCECGSGCYQGAAEYGGYGDGCERASLNGAGAKCHGLSSLLVFRGARTPESG